MGRLRTPVLHSTRITSTCPRASTSRCTRLVSTSSPGLFEGKNVVDKSAEKPPWDWQRMVRVRERRAAIRELPAFWVNFDITEPDLSKSNTSPISDQISVEKIHIDRIMASIDLRRVKVSPCRHSWPPVRISGTSSLLCSPHFFPMPTGLAPE
jgi:hypothetical protein